MIIISDNFSDSKTLLRKEAKLREDENKPADEFLENEVWLLFYKLGFTKLNIGRECEIKFGKKTGDLATKKIDVLAESLEVRVYIECTTQQVDSTKIKQWSSEVDDIRKYESINPETEKKNIVFVYCNNSTISEIDREKLSRKGIVYVNTTIIDYFSELHAQYSRLSYFQLICTS